MKKFHFPQLFNQVVGTMPIPVSTTQHNLCHRESQLSEANGHVSTKTFKLLNFKAPFPFNHQFRMKTEQDESKFHSRVFIESPNNGKSEHRSFEKTLQQIKVEVEPTQKIYMKIENNDEQKIQGEKRNSKKRRTIIKKGELYKTKKGEKHSRTAVTFRVSEGKGEKGNTQTSRLKKEKDEEKEREREKQQKQIKRSNISYKNYNRMKKQFQDKIKEEREKYIQKKNQRKRNSKYSNKSKNSHKLINREYFEKESGFVGDIKKRQKKKLTIVDPLGQKSKRPSPKHKNSILRRINTFQNIYIRKGSLQANNQFVFYSEKALSEEQCESSQSELQEEIENRRDTEIGTEKLSTKKRVHFYHEPLNEQKPMLNRRRESTKKKKPFLLRKDTKVTSIENIIIDDEQEENEKSFKRNKNMKRFTLTKNNKKIEDNIYTELNYFNMRLQDKPKQVYDDEYDSLNKPSIIPMTVEFNEQETELVRKKRWKIESEMIDLGVRMGRGYLLRQTPIR